MSDFATQAPADATEVDVGEIIRIVDPELDVEAIMAEIRANLARRGPLDPDPSGMVYRANEAMWMSSQAELEWLLERAESAQRELVIGDQLRPGPGAVSRIATRLKRPLHQLARFYVELLASRQAAVNGHLISAVGLLTSRSTAAQDELVALRREVAELRAELARLRQPTEQASPEPQAGPTPAG